MKSIILFAVAGYIALMALMYLAQRSMMYFPDTTRRAPTSAGLAQAEEVTLQTADGERVIAWHVPAQGENPVVLYFQGNGGGLNLRADRFRRLVSSGIGLVALNYRGYGGSSGSPSEAGLIADAMAAYDFAAARYPAERIAVWGESLGTGVAAALAAQRPVARVILESPYTSIADIAAAVYWFVPVRLLIKDPFRSDQRIGKVSAPVLVLHGALDNIVPIEYGERLYALIRAPKRFLRLTNAGHNDHDTHGALEAIREFLVIPGPEPTGPASGRPDDRLGEGTRNP
ncbi:MAG: alpha/beta fold hydrolase [Rhizobiales bacterium]|nr:alpha/beta fold hydrolase [Hyphomicrobiales bacterium]